MVTIYHHTQVASQLSEWPGEKNTYWSEASLDTVLQVHLWVGPGFSVGLSSLAVQMQTCKVVSSQH